MFVELGHNTISLHAAADKTRLTTNKIIFFIKPQTEYKLNLIKYT